MMDIPPPGEPRALNPAHAAFQQAVLTELVAEYRIGYFLTYYRAFATPTTAAILSRGEIPKDPVKRSYDTAIVIMELVYNGLDSERGAAFIDFLVRAHSSVRASTAEYQYVLYSLHFIPARWINAHGRRHLTPVEQSASFEFWNEVGRRMGVAGLYDTESEAAAFFDNHTAAHVRRTEHSVALMDLTVGVLGGRLPRIVRPAVRPIVATLIDDEAMTTALGVKMPGRLFRTLVYGVLKARLRRSHPSSESSFAPGRAASRVYPDGYSISDIGPQPTRDQ